jgi:hypothetical protein
MDELILLSFEARKLSTEQQIHVKNIFFIFSG